VETMRVQLAIRGVVQGVGFRPFVYRTAKDFYLNGWVANSRSGVFVELEGAAAQVWSAIDRIRSTPPPAAVIEDFSVEQKAPKGYDRFEIIESVDELGEGCEAGVAGSAGSAGSAGAAGSAGSAGAVASAACSADIATLKHRIKETTLSVAVAPDLAICPDCRSEMITAKNRRFRHPFITCTNCGPRYTIVKTVPYDRMRTTMDKFPLCPQCANEYSDPGSRRHHAQPIACPDCGPQVKLMDAKGAIISGGWGWGGAADGDRGGKTGNAAIRIARRMLQRGKIIAVQGVGGFHLACLATNSAAVRRLRRAKGRADGSPLAVMVHDLKQVSRIAAVNAAAAKVISSPEAPIVLLRARYESWLAPEVNAGSRYVGVMLAYSPLHLLLTENMPPLVMTSGNRSGEPMVTTIKEARRKLRDIADAFLIHNRPIERRCDDSVVQIEGSAETKVIRRSRGMVPGEIELPVYSRPLLACGAEQKSVACLAAGNKAILSAHLGDLKSSAGLQQYQYEIGQLASLTGVTPRLVACDLHPDYLSSAFARQLGLPCVEVQHHHAHIAAVLAEHRKCGPVIGVAFDGAGYGTDGQIWGGEFLIADAREYARVAHLAYIPQPGGDLAVLNPWRMAGAYLETYCADLQHLWPAKIKRLMKKEQWMLIWLAARQGLGAPMTSSIGRLFDAVSALLGLCDHAGYEGEAAIKLEALTRLDFRSYPFDIRCKDGVENVVGAAATTACTATATAAVTATASDTATATNELGGLFKQWIIDPKRMIRGILTDLHMGISPTLIAGRFHQSVAEMVGKVCSLIREESGLNEVALAGGVFDNAILRDATKRVLARMGFSILLNKKVPGNDGGIALGQALVAAISDRSERGKSDVSGDTWACD